MSICSGNIFSPSEKSGLISGQPVWENWVFSLLAARRFYFWLNYSGKHLLLNIWVCGHLVLNILGQFYRNNFSFLYFLKTFLFSFAMFFLLVIWVFILILGLFYTFLTFWVSFHRYTPFGGYGGPEKDQILLALSGLF